MNYNAYFWNREPVAECTAQKIRLSPPELGFPAVVVSKKIPEVVALGRQLLRSLDLYGFSCTEFKMDERDGRYKLMEVNARPNMSGALSVRCGVDFPYIMYSHLASGRTSSINDYQTGSYWIDTLADLKRGMRNGYSGAARMFRAPYFRQHVNAVLDFRDLSPFASDCLRGGQTLMRRLTTRIPR